MMTENIKHKIDDYLQGRMSNEERILFEQSMKEDRWLNEEVTRTALIINTIKTVGSEDDKKYLDALKSLSRKDLINIVNEKTRKRKIKRLYFAFSAIAAIIVFAVALNIWHHRNGTILLYDAYYTPLAVDSHNISRGTSDISLEESKLIDKAFAYYEKNEYKDALTIFMKVKSEEVYIFNAICLMETKRDKEAISLLESLKGKGDSYQYYQDACWYLSLVYIKTNNPEHAKTLLKQIIEEDGYYADRATKLLKDCLVIQSGHLN